MQQSTQSRMALSRPDITYHLDASRMFRDFPGFLEILPFASSALRWQVTPFGDAIPNFLPISRIVGGAPSSISDLMKRRISLWRDVRDSLMELQPIWYPACGLPIPRDSGSPSPNQEADFVSGRAPDVKICTYMVIAPMIAPELSAPIARCRFRQKAYWWVMLSCSPVRYVCQPVAGNGIVSASSSPSSS